MDSINPAFNQKYTFIKYHVNIQLRKWKVLKPYFATKLAKSTSPAIKSIMVQCLTIFCKQINDAMSNVSNAINYITVMFTVHDFHAEKRALLDDVYSLRKIGFVAQSEAAILLLKFKNSEPIPFKKFPYDFQSRLVALLPLYDMTAFTLAGNGAAKSVKRRGERRGKTFSNCLTVTDGDYSSLFTETYEKDKYYDFLNTNSFLKLDNYYISGGICLESDSVGTFDHAVNIVSGDYRFVDLRCFYTWRHAIHLMNVSKFIKFTSLWYYIELPVEDFDEFFEAVVQCLLNKKSVIMFRMVYHHLDASFRSRFETVIKARTALNIHFLDELVVVYKSIEW